MIQKETPHGFRTKTSCGLSCTNKSTNPEAHERQSVGDSPASEAVRSVHWGDASFLFFFGGDYVLEHHQIFDGGF